FFQAEDGIRDKLVTGVQTCALPISLPGPQVVAGEEIPPVHQERAAAAGVSGDGNCEESRRDFARLVVERDLRTDVIVAAVDDPRSEERRVGKEWRCRWSTQHVTSRR